MTYPSFGNVQGVDWVRTDSETAVSSVSADLPSGVAAGTTIVLVCVGDHVSGTLATPPGFTKELEATGGGYPLRAIFSKAAVGDETSVTVAWNGATSAAITVVALVLGGVVAFEGASHGTGGGGEQWSTPSITTTGPDRLVLHGGAIIATSGDASTPSETTLITTGNNGSASWMNLGFFQWPEAGSTAGNSRHRWGANAQNKGTYSIAAYLAEPPPTGAEISLVEGDGLDTVRAGEAFTIAGSGFEAAQGSGTVALGGESCTVTAWADDEITATAPVDGLMFGGSKSLVVTPDSNDPDTVSITYLPPTGQAHVTYDGSTVTERSVFWDAGLEAPIAGLATGDQCRYELVAVRDGGTEECDVLVEAGTGVITLASIETSGDYVFDVWVRDATDGSDSAAKTVLVDSTPPPGTVSWDQDQITDANETAASFTFAGVEVGVDYEYEITSSDGGTPVADSGTFATATDQITALDLSGLADGTLTLTVTMTDGVGNETIISDTIGKAAADETAPSLTSATIDSAGTSLTLAFSEAVEFGAGSNGGWSLSMPGASLTYSSGSGTSSLVYTIGRVVGSHESGTVSYTQPGDGVQDGAGNDLASLSGFGITNNSEADSISPVLSSLAVDSTGGTLTVTLNEAAAVGDGGGGGLTLSASGGAVTATYDSTDGNGVIFTLSRTIKAVETLTASYVQPGDGITDTAGNELASFSSETVANNSTANSPPTDISLSRNTVRTNAGLNALVGTLTATDPDAGDSHTFSLVEGDGDDNNASFTVSGNQLLCDDPESLGAGSYSVRVEVSDGTDAFEKAFSITVQDVPADSFIRSPVTVSITIEVSSEVAK